MRVGRLLANGGLQVFGTTRSEAREDELRSLGIEPVLANVLEPESLERLPAADWVVYCVGSDRRSAVPMRAVHVDGLRLALERLAGRVKRLVYSSSTGVYGPQPEGWVTEQTPAEPNLESGRVVYEAERLLFELAPRQGLEAVVVRLAGLYGPGRIVRRVLVERGEPIPGSGDHLLNLVQIDDAAVAVVAALERGRSGEVYLAADDRPVTRREYYGLLAELLGVAAPRFMPPEPGSPEALRDAAQKRVSNRKMKAELGVILSYPDITTGMPAALAVERAGAAGPTPGE
jgi:nucleoside-diphosphate-sugar epimerase